MTSTLTLRHGDLLCDIKPELGGSIAGLWLGTDPVLSSVPGAQMQAVRQSGSYPLVPFSNRIGQAQLQWAGTSHPLVRNFDPEPHAIHGVGWQRPWAVLESSDTFALLSLEHRADAAWPFDFDCSQAFKLEAGALEMSLSITNQSPVAAPVGLGWHPFFPKRPGTEVQFSATGRWEMGSDKLPTHRVDHPGLHQTVEALTVDHCFDGWGGVLTLQDSVMRVRVSSALRHLVVYTHPQRDNIAVEPVSHVNNALNLMTQTGARAEDLGVVILQAGQTYSCEMRIEVERTV
ncbi:aldose 1-epimerase [Rhodoferax sp. TS-BS-61-7]|uniref:aldose 1-epimerase n=1 Tax=Rhodoferax sp. TS-BS-61-7 TaxID=2094194 RepID=UPI000CF5E6D2|nr:aldose 1-epimerase [Rhodoferax sp. TS-BS-61-7]PQA77139.1 aldose 1-epimerase [Rhodoferax sp. TS-BS-61-7]